MGRRARWVAGLRLARALLKSGSLERHAVATAFVEPASPSQGEARILYGDSSPFPYGLDFLSSIRALIDCSVAMLAAQSSIDDVVKRAAQLEQGLKGERWKFDALLDAVDKSVNKVTAPLASGSPRVVGAAAELMATARAIVEREQLDLEQRWTAQMSGSERIVDEACSAASQALEALLLKHVPPQSSLAWRLAADEHGYDGRVLLTTRFGLEAHFGIAIPEAHRWARLKRVADLSPGTVVHAPKPGKRSRAAELHEVSLDRLVVTECLIDVKRIAFRLRRSPRAGAGYRFEVSTDNGDTSMQLLDELGEPVGDVREVEVGERDSILRLASAMLDSTFDLVLRRQLMIGASLDGAPLRERFEPREVCARIVGAYAPIVAEIARRSAPTELMLRKDLGGGRREAIFVTRAELRGKLLRLPAALKAMFEPFGL